MEYVPTIGLEVHAELKTKTKMFCNSKNDPDEKRPNVNICPVCMAHPGTLPVINKEAVRHVLRMGAAIGADLADYTEWDRKNYFYPDIPKGYQISQYKYPLVSKGVLNGVEITRIHLEEDTARSSHEGDKSLVDFNRAGLPLMELVTEPVIHSAGEAVAFAKELQILLRTLHAGEANMEKGEMRVEANISVAKDGGRGTKVEVKNLNSFRAVQGAIEYEVKRQAELLEKGEKVVQETRGWDEAKGVTYSQRLKEDSHDYRYFPDPDLPKLVVSEIPEFNTEALKAGLPELPWAKRERYLALGLKKEDAETLIGDTDQQELFDEVTRGKERDFALRCANYITSDIIGLSVAKGIHGTGKITPASFSELISMTFDGRLSSRGAKDILAILFTEGGETGQVAEAKGLIQKNDEGALGALVDQVISENEKAVAEVKAGKESAIQALVGQAMKLSKGSANPQMLQKLFKDKLK